MQDVAYKPPYAAENQAIPKEQPKLGYERLCLLYGTRIQQAGFGTSGPEFDILYTVPSGKIFLLTSASLSVHIPEQAADCTSHLNINGGTQQVGQIFSILRVPVCSSGEVNSDAGEAAMLSISPCIPIRMVAGERVELYNSSPDSETHATITGYEIDSNLFYTLL